MKYYYYGMRMRGCSPGCQPLGIIDRKDDPSRRYYDIIYYTRKLAPEELETYELDFLREEEVPDDPGFVTLVVAGEPES